MPFYFLNAYESLLKLVIFFISIKLFIDRY